MSWDAPVWKALDQVRDGYFFVLIVVTELLLEGFTGSGVFTSQQMVGGTKTLVTVALAVALIPGEQDMKDGCEQPGRSSLCRAVALSS